MRETGFEPHAHSAARNEAGAVRPIYARARQSLTECAIQFEPVGECCKYEGPRAGLSQIPSRGFKSGVELSEVVSAWPRLPGALRAGVLAIVRSHVGEQVGRGTGREKSFSLASPVVPCPCASRDGVCVGQRRGCPFVADDGLAVVRRRNERAPISPAMAARKNPLRSWSR